MKPYIIKSRSLSNSDARNFAKAVLGNTATKPEPPKPEFKPELVITPTTEPELKEIEPAINAPAAEETVVESTVIEEPEKVAEEVIEPCVEEVVENVQKEGTALEELGLSSSNVKNLKSNSINTVEELEAFVNSGEQLAALPKIGTKAEQAITEALIKWKEQNQK